MPWMDLVWCLGGGSSLMESLLRPLFLPHLIKAMRACHDVSVCLLLWIFMKLFWRPHLPQHLAQHLVHTCSHCPHLVQHLPHLHGASQCRVWIYMKLATAASLLSFFSPITLFLILIFRLFIFHIFNKVDCRSTWKSLANTADPLSSLPFQLITFSTLLSEIKGHHRLPTFQQISLFGWSEEILYNQINRMLN